MSLSEVSQNDQPSTQSQIPAAWRDLEQFITIDASTSLNYTRAIEQSPWKERILEIMAQTSDLLSLDRQVKTTLVNSYIAAGSYPEPQRIRIQQELSSILSSPEGVVKAFTDWTAARVKLATSLSVFTLMPGLTSGSSLALGDINLASAFASQRSRDEVNLDDAEIAAGVRSEQPFVPANMRSVIGPELAEKMIEAGGFAIFHRFARAESHAGIYTEPPLVQSEIEERSEKLEWAHRYKEKAFFSCGTTRESIEFAKQLLRLGVGGICLDIAHGNTIQGIEAVLELRKTIDKEGLPGKIIAGNVDSAEGYLNLTLAGADAVKVGIGPGAACTTRSVAKAGVGQMSALFAVQAAAMMLGDKAAKIIADGGMKESGDLLLCLTIADLGMFGSAMCRLVESAAFKRNSDGKDQAFYHGEAAAEAVRLNNAFKDQSGFRTNRAGNRRTMPEGKGGWLDIVGTFDSFYDKMHGGLANAFTYYDANSLATLRNHFSIPHQMCRLALGQSTGYQASGMTYELEKSTRFDRDK